MTDNKPAAKSSRLRIASEAESPPTTKRRKLSLSGRAAHLSASDFADSAGVSSFFWNTHCANDETAGTLTPPTLQESLGPAGSPTSDSQPGPPSSPIPKCPGGQSSSSQVDHAKKEASKSVLAREYVADRKMDRSFCKAVACGRCRQVSPLVVHVGPPSTCSEHHTCVDCVLDVVDQHVLCVERNTESLLNTEFVVRQEAKSRNVRGCPSCGAGCVSMMGEGLFYLSDIEYMKLRRFAESQEHAELGVKPAECPYCQLKVGTAEAETMVELIKHVFRCRERRFICDLSQCRKPISWSRQYNDFVRRSAKRPNDIPEADWLDLLNEALQNHFQTGQCKQRSSCAHLLCPYSREFMDSKEAWRHAEVHEPPSSLIEVKECVERLTQLWDAYSVTLFVAHKSRLVCCPEKSGNIVETTVRPLLASALQCMDDAYKQIDVQLQHMKNEIDKGKANTGAVSPRSADSKADPKSYPLPLSHRAPTSSHVPGYVSPLTPPHSLGGDADPVVQMLDRVSFASRVDMPGGPAATWHVVVRTPSPPSPGRRLSPLAMPA